MYFSVPVALLLAAACLTLASCAPAPPRDGQRDSKNPPAWPAPPEPPRFVYETTLRSPVDIQVENEEDRLRRLMTGAPPPDKPAFEKPAAIAAAKGRIYVADTVLRLIVVFDVPRRRVFRFGWRDPGRLTKPTGLALDAAGNVYVMDATAKRVHIYDSLGLFLRAVGNPKDFERPVGVAVDPEGKRIYVVDRATNDSDNHRVVALDRDGARLFELGPRGKAEGRFNVPVQAAVAADGTLHVLDAGNFRVQSFAPDGRFLRAFGAAGAGYGQFARPRGIAVDRDGKVYVADASFGNFQVFDREGKLLLAVGSQGRDDRPGRYGLVSGVAVDETGRVYVVDQLFNKVEVIRPVPAGGEEKP
jgi:DNA-binding beta-propeller fold protein YncE